MIYFGNIHINVYRKYNVLWICFFSIKIYHTELKMFRVIPGKPVPLVIRMVITFQMCFYTELKTLFSLGCGEIG